MADPAAVGDEERMTDREKVAKEKLDEIVDMCRGLNYRRIINGILQVLSKHFGKLGFKEYR